MLTIEEWRAIVYQGRMAFDTIDDNGRKHDERGRFTVQSAGNQAGIKIQAKARAAKILQGSPVTSLQSSDAPREYPALRTWASELFRAAKGAVVLKSAHGRDMTSAYVCAPVKIDGADDIVTVLVRKDPNSQRMYLHSVTTKENLLKSKDSGTDAKFGVERSGKVTSGDVASILRVLLKFNRNGDND